MVVWLAVVAFCGGGQCAFWASTDELFTNEATCAEKVLQAEAYLQQQGATSSMSVCLPIKWQGKKV
jgi:hypothetical protein